MSSQEPLNQCEDGVFDWCWSETHHGREVHVHSDKHTITFHQNRSNFSTAIRGTKILRKNMEHYFEIEMKSPFFGQARQVGLGTEHTPLESNNYDFTQLIGKDMASWGVNYDGSKYHHSVHTKYISIDLDKHEEIRISVLYDSYYGTLAFKFNGRSNGVAFDRVLTNLDLYPMLCSSGTNSVMRLTHCCSSVMSLKGLCRGIIRQNIHDDKHYDKLSVPSHIKAFLLYKTPKSKSSRRTDDERNNSPPTESTI